MQRDLARVPVEFATEGLPWFRGCTCDCINRYGFTFIRRATIEQIGGPDLVLPPQDLMIHINENRDLGNILPTDTWITFYLRREPKRKSGLEVFGGQYERAVAPA